MKELLLLIISFIMPLKENSFEKDFIIHTEETPTQIYWISDDVILLSYTSYAEIFNLNNRKRNRLEECKNCLYGYDKEIVLCEYEHRVINNTNEYSTEIKVRNMNGEVLLEKGIFPTVIPSVCKKDSILLKNAFPFLEEKFYRLSKDGFGEITVKRESRTFKGIAKYKSISVGKERILVLDWENTLWVYKRVTF
jgi:hypothetical protein